VVQARAALRPTFMINLSQAALPAHMASPQNPTANSHLRASMTQAEQLLIDDQR